METLFSILSLAKDAGFDVGQFIVLGMIYFMLKNFVSKQNDELKKVVDEQVNKIVTAIHNHNERLDNLEDDVKDIKQQLKKE